MLNRIRREISIFQIKSNPIQLHIDNPSNFNQEAKSHPPTWGMAYEKIYRAAFALLASSANACSSDTARSASILRFTSMPATFKPCIKRL